MKLSISSVLDFFKLYKVTSVIICLNICMFLLMVFMGVSPISPSGHELLSFGAIARAYVEDGEYWRLMTTVFIHAGIMHLMVNLIALMIGGFYLDGLLGVGRLIFLYLLCGVLASIGSIIWNDGGVSVGASGAILGLYGIIFVFTVAKIYPTRERNYSWLLVCLYAGLGIVFGFLVGADYATHIGGFLTGVTAGVLMVLLDKDNLKKIAEKNFR